LNFTLDIETPLTMPNVLANCDALILPSHREGLGIALLEGMAAGIPVIGSKTSGIKEIIRDKENGLFVQPNNPRNIAEKIMYLYSDEKMRRGLVKNGQRDVRTIFSLQKQLVSLEKIYAK